eukprot:scaffold17273_cov97-Isochrysis_galbana.AAC.4
MCCAASKCCGSSPDQWSVPALNQTINRQSSKDNRRMGQGRLGRGDGRRDNDVCEAAKKDMVEGGYVWHAPRDTGSRATAGRA